MNTNLFFKFVIAALYLALTNGAFAQELTNSPFTQKDLSELSRPIEQYTFRMILRGSALKSRIDLQSEAVADLPISELSPERVWKLAESADLFADGFPSYENVTVLMYFCEVIGAHPMKSQFVDFMLPKIANLPLPTYETHEPVGWNEACIVSNGGLAGVLIANVVTKIASNTDFPKVVNAILATHDAAKIEKLKVAISVSPNKIEFEKILEQAIKHNGADIQKSSNNSVALAPQVSSVHPPIVLPKPATDTVIDAKTVVQASEQINTPSRVPIVATSIAATALLCFVIKRLAKSESK